MIIEKNFSGEIFDDIESMQEFHALMDMMGERECLILFASPELVSQIVNNDDMRFHYEYTCDYVYKDDEESGFCYIVEIPKEQEGMMRTITGGIGETPFWFKISGGKTVFTFPGFPVMEVDFATELAEELEYDISRRLSIDF